MSFPQNSNQKNLNLQVKRNMKQEVLPSKLESAYLIYEYIWVIIYILLFALVNMEIKLGAAPFNPDIDSCCHVLKLIPYCTFTGD